MRYFNQFCIIIFFSIIIPKDHFFCLAPKSLSNSPFDFLYKKKIEKSFLGEEIGEGAFKKVYRVKDVPNLVVGAVFFYKFGMGMHAKEQIKMISDSNNFLSTSSPLY